MDEYKETERMKALTDRDLSINGNCSKTDRCARSLLLPFSRIALDCFDSSKAHEDISQDRQLLA